MLTCNTAPLAASPLPLLAGLPEDATTGKTPVSPLNLLYDVSRPEDVSVVATEAGLIPVESVPVLLRDYKVCGLARVAWCAWRWRWLTKTLPRVLFPLAALDAGRYVTVTACNVYTAYSRM